MLQKRLNQRTLESCHGPYKNSWFLVKKKKKSKYQLINTVFDINKVTTWDANLSPSINKFSKDFVGCVVASFVDFFSSYNQTSLIISSQDFTAFMMFLRRLHMTQLFMEATNLVAQFVWIVIKIFQDYIPDVAG